VSNQSAGASRQRVMLYAIVGGVVWVTLMVGLIVAGLNRRSTFYGQETAARGTLIALDVQGQTNTAVASETQAFQTNEANTATQSFFATQTDAPTPTPTIDPTRRTLPPPETLAPPTAEAGVAAQAEATLAPLPQELASGQIIGYGGTDFSGSGYLPMLLIPLDGSGTTRQLGSETINNVQIDPLTGQNLIYTRYFPVTFNAGIEVSNLSGTETEPLQNLWQGIDGFNFLDVGQVSFAQGGQRLVFRAQIPGEGNYQLFVVDFTRVGIPNEAPVQQITQGDANYAFPAISPDGSRVTAIKTDPNALDPAPDIVSIETGTGNETPVTTNTTTFYETRSAFYPNENAIVFAASEGPDGQSDIFRLALQGDVQPLPLIRTTESNETHPVISPDGRYLAYASDRNGDYNVFVTDLETSETYQVTNVVGDDVYPEDWFIDSLAPGQRTPPLLPLPTPVIPEAPADQTDG